MPRRKRRAKVFSSDSLKSAGLAAGKLVGLLGLIGSLLQGWQAGRKASEAKAESVAATSEANTARVYAGASAGRWRGRVDSLVNEVARLKADVAAIKRARPYVSRPEFGPEPAPPDYRPESHGLLWKLKNLGTGR